MGRPAAGKNRPAVYRRLRPGAVIHLCRHQTPFRPGGECAALAGRAKRRRGYAYPETAPRSVDPYVRPLENRRGLHPRHVPAYRQRP